MLEIHIPPTHPEKVESFLRASKYPKYRLFAEALRRGKGSGYKRLEDVPYLHMHGYTLPDHGDGSQGIMVSPLGAHFRVSGKTFGKLYPHFHEYHHAGFVHSLTHDDVINMVRDVKRGEAGSGVIEQRLGELDDHKFKNCGRESQALSTLLDTHRNRPEDVTAHRIGGGLHVSPTYPELTHFLGHYGIQANVGGVKHVLHWYAPPARATPRPATHSTPQELFDRDDAHDELMEWLEDHPEHMKVANGRFVNDMAHAKYKKLAEAEKALKEQRGY